MLMITYVVGVSHDSLITTTVCTFDEFVPPRSEIVPRRRADTRLDYNHTSCDTSFIHDNRYQVIP